MKMQNMIKKKKILAAVCALMVIAIPFLWYWLFGWGTIQIIDFSATDVDYVEISCSHRRERGTISNPSEIQALINEANSMKNKGSSLKELIHGIFMGGAVLYESAFYLNDGTEFLLTFSSNNSEVPVSDMSLTYWYQRTPPGVQTDGTVCRGSLEVYFNLFEKYANISPDYTASSP